MAGYDRLFGFDTTQKQTLENYVADEIATQAAGAVPAATTTVNGTVKQSAVQNPAAAADVAALKTQFDALLTKLKAAGLMAS